MKTSKILILLFTLSFPVILYLFLRSYGVNKYELPIFFDDTQKLLCRNPAADLELLYLFPAKSSDSIPFRQALSADYKVIHFPDIEYVEIQSLKNELSRVLNTLSDISIHTVTLIPLEADDMDNIGMNEFITKDAAYTYRYDSQVKDELIHCVFAFPTNEWNGRHPSEEIIPVEETLILLDQNNQIRGYYNGFKTKEVDRLILEMSVLLSNQ